MSEQSPFIKAERPGTHVLLIRIARPEKRNALSNAMVLAMAALLADAAGDDTRCVVLAGADEAFCAGADIGELAATGGKAVNDPERIAAWHAIEEFPKPLIAAVNGFAFGAGNELAMLCDFIIAGKNAKFGQPEVKIGGMPGDGGTQRLPQKIGPGLAAMMMFTGDPIDADAALRAGHVVEIADNAEARAIEIAKVIASRAPLSVQAVKAAIRRTQTIDLAFERNEMWKLTGIPDNIEGGRAFLEKRPPKFTGRWR